MRSIRLKISISGVRGVVGETLSPQLLTRFAMAFGTYVGPGRVLVGRDTRVSGPMVAQAVCAGLMATGCRPVDAGIVPIPALQRRCAHRTDARGAIAITASHNPAEWNALKLLSSQGLFLSTQQASELLDIYHQEAFRRCSGAEVPGLDADDGVVEAHLQAVIDQVDARRIAGAGLTVGLDCVNGAGAVASPQLLERLGCQVVPIACEPTGHFPRPPEPLPEHLGELCQLVRSGQAQLGFAQDADADRLALVDERGRALDGDLLLALLIDQVLERTPGPVVVNLSTSNLVETVAARHGVPVYRSPVGEANVVEEMMRRQAVVGGEGSGGFILPAVHSCRDSFSAMALVLQYLAGGGEIARWVDALPPRTRHSERYEVPSALARFLIFELRRLLIDGELDLRDGIKASWPDRWVQVRASNTEPLLRVQLEAESQAAAQALRQRLQQHLHDLRRRAPFGDLT